MADLTNQNWGVISQLSEILANDEELEEGSFDLSIFEIEINKIPEWKVTMLYFYRFLSLMLFIPVMILIILTIILKWIGNHFLGI